MECLGFELRLVSHTIIFVLGASGFAPVERCLSARTVVRLPLKAALPGRIAPCRNGPTRNRASQINGVCSGVSARKTSAHIGEIEQPDLDVRIHGTHIELAVYRANSGRQTGELGDCLIHV